jgi:hypothetical protein
MRYLRFCDKSGIRAMVWLADAKLRGFETPEVLRVIGSNLGFKSKEQPNPFLGNF